MDIARHASKGLKAWEISTIEAQVENTLENAALNWNDPESLGVQNVLGRQAVIDSSEMMGLSTEATAEKLQTYESSFASSTITAAIQSSAADGRDALEKYGPKLEGPDKVKMQAAIEKKAKVEKTQSDAAAATLTATRLVSQYDSREDIMTEVDKIEDPELRKKTMTETMTQFNRKKTAIKEREAEYYDVGIEHFNKGGTAEQFKASNPEAWEGMSEKQRNNLLAGKHMTTDQIKFNAVLSLPRSQLATVEPAEYVDQFKPSDVAKLRKAVDKAKKGQEITSIQSPSRKATSVAEQFFGKQKTWKGNKAKQAKVDEFMKTAQDKIEEAEELKGGKLTPTELDNVMADFSRTFAAERSKYGLDMLASDVNIDLSNTPPEQVAEMSKLVNKHGEEAFQQAVKYLDSKEIPITTERLLKLMREVKVTK